MNSTTDLPSPCSGSRINATSGGVKRPRTNKGPPSFESDQRIERAAQVLASWELLCMHATTKGEVRSHRLGKKFALSLIKKTRVYRKLVFATKNFWLGSQTTMTCGWTKWM